MKILLIFWTFSLISEALKAFSVTGYSGGNIVVRSWKPWHKGSAKYMKKLKNSAIIDDRDHDRWINEGRFTLFKEYDNLVIYIRDLDLQDAGIYTIGVKRNWNIEMTLKVEQVTDSCCTVSKTVMVNSGETAIFSCEYSKDFLYYNKVMFKEEKYSFEVIYNSWKKKETFLISDDKLNNLLSVRINAVRPDDGGAYLCGVWAYRHQYSYSILNTVHLYIITKVGNSRVMGYSGAPLMIKCEHPQHKTKPKYICRESDGCSERKSPGVRDQWVENGDVSLYDDTGAGVLMVFFRELKDTDGGRYRCGVNESDYTERFTELQLNIRHDTNYSKSMNESVHLGGDVNIFCQIPEKHKLNFCKEDENHICRNIISSKVSETSPSFERNEERVLSVSFSNVSVRDAGVYWCGAETRDTHLTFISLSTRIQLILLIKVGESRVTGYSGALLMIKCEHPQHKTKPKYICKESDGCLEKKSPGVRDQWVENGDVSLYDDTGAGVLMVFFRELKDTDEGRYRCGVNESDYTERVAELQLNIRHDATFVNKSSHLGGEINITCQIPEKHKLHFCKEDENHICQNISSSKVSETSPSSERNEERVLSVSFSNVSVRDAGVYWCGAETRDTHLTFISLNTRIQLILLMSPVVRREGESAEIICPYDSLYKSKPKSLCKGKCSTRDRNPLNETLREEKEPKPDRLTLNDDATASVFTGTITALTAEDAGEYWCAVTLGKTLDYLYTHLIVIMNEELNLTQYEGDDMSIQCKRQNHNQKIFCKAHEASMCVKDGVSLETIRDDRFSFSDEASAGVFTVTITDLRADDSGTYWCGAHDLTKVNLEVKTSVSNKIISGVCVTLLLIGTSVLLLYKLGYIKTRVNCTDASPSSGGTERSPEEDCQAACDYENFRDVNSVSGTEEALYSNVEKPTDSSDSRDGLYSMVQLPTTPSDGILYSSVRFHKHEESGSDGKVIFNNEEIYSDYTVVSHTPDSTSHD